MQNTQTPLTVEFNSPTNTKSVEKESTEYDIKKWLHSYLNVKGFKIYQLTTKDFDFYENKEMWITSFIYCLFMDRLYTKKYLMINSKSLRFSCTIMNIMIPYFFLFHSKIIYQNNFK